jgi:hypothetical protein
MRSPSLPLALALLALTACARETGTRQARARAGSDAHVAPGELAAFTASCEGCVGAPQFHWSIDVAPLDATCALQGADLATVGLACPEPGLWVLRVDVTDDDGPGQPDFANLMVSPISAVDAGEPDAGPVDAGEPDAGPVDAGSVDAGEPDAGPPDAGPPDAGPPDAGPLDAGPPDAGPPDAGAPDAGPLTGTLTVTLPDGTPATTVLPGDLLELHATPSDPTATCTFDALGSSQQALATTVPCTAAVVLRAPMTGVGFGVTFHQGGRTAHITAGPVSAVAPALLYASSTQVTSVAVDPVSGWALAARPTHSAIAYDPGADTTDLISAHHDGVATAGGGVLQLGWTSGNLGRAYVDGGLAQHGSGAGDFISATTLSTYVSGAYQPQLVATDGDTFVTWADTGTEHESASYSVDAVYEVRDPGAAQPTSAGLLTVADQGDTLQYLPFLAVRSYARLGTPFLPEDVASPIDGVVRIATGVQGQGTCWLADDTHHVSLFRDTLGGVGFALSNTPALQLLATGPIDDLAVEQEGPYAGDLWIAGGGLLQRLNASTNTVGAAPTVVGVLLSPSVGAVAVDRRNGTRRLYLGCSDGFYGASP